MGHSEDLVYALCLLALCPIKSSVIELAPTAETALGQQHRRLLRVYCWQDRGYGVVSDCDPN